MMTPAELKPAPVMGELLVITAPSGAGKSSLINALRKQDPRVGVSISHTTRAPRVGEQDGLAYHFVSRAEFIALRDGGEFLEWAEVYDNFYGTSQQALNRLRAQGHDIILEIDWQGARQVRQLFPEARGVFILPPSLDILRQRLILRGKDDAATITRRLALAADDISHESEFDYVIINEVFDEAVADLAAIIRALRCCRKRQAVRCSALFSLSTDQ